MSSSSSSSSQSVRSIRTESKRNGTHSSVSAGKSADVESESLLINNNTANSNQHLSAMRSTDNESLLSSEQSQTQSKGERAAERRRWVRIRNGFYLLITVTSIAVALYFALRPTSDSSSGPLPPPENCQRKGSFGQNGAVATTNSYATDAGLAILQAGGNAFDAAAAVQFMLNVVQPQSTGIGGGCFVTFYSALTGQVHFLDGREEAPNRFNATSFCANYTCLYDANCGCSNGSWAFSDRVTGGHPVGVPGVVSAMARLMNDWGTMKWADVLAPAIQRAKDGFVMYNDLYQKLLSNYPRLSLFPASLALFYPNSGAPVPVGQLFQNPDLANTFQLLADQGADVFYKGQLAQEILQTVWNAVNPTTKLYGVMEPEDLGNYSAVYRPAAAGSYRNLSLYSSAPPSSGGLSLLQMLNQLESFDVSSFAPSQGEYFHRLIDVQDITFADRNLYMADADFLDTPMPMSGLLDKNYAHQRFLQFSQFFTAARPVGSANLPAGNPPNITAQNAQNVGMSLRDFSAESADLLNDFKKVYASMPENGRKGTTHFTIADAFGNVVSMTTTIEQNLGSGVVVPKRGFLLNNELTDFMDLPNDPTTGKPYANGPQGGKRLRKTALGSDALTIGGKRPMSSMTPTIALIPASNGGLYPTAAQVAANDRSSYANSTYPGSLSPLYTAFRPFLAMGSPGGSQIISTVLNSFINFVDFTPACLADAVDAPRVCSRNTGGVQLEPVLYTNSQYTAAVQLLKDRKFQLASPSSAAYLGYTEALVIRDDGWIEAVADQIRLPSASAAAY